MADRDLMTVDELAAYPQGAPGHDILALLKRGELPVFGSWLLIWRFSKEAIVMHSGGVSKKRIQKLT